MLAASVVSALFLAGIFIEVTRTQRENTIRLSFSSLTGPRSNDRQKN